MLCMVVYIKERGVSRMSKHANVGYNNVGSVSDTEKKITKKKFAKSLTRSLRQFAPVLLGKEKPKGNIREKIANWKKLAEDVEDE